MTHITDELVVQIRERHDWLRSFREDEDTGDWMTDAAIDAKVAEEMNVSPSYVKALVTGEARKGVGGPIDHARNARQALYHEEAQTLGVTEARRRLQLRSRNIDPTPKALRYVQRVTILDAKGRPTPGVVDLAPGETVRVELVAVGGDR
ncbi:hypothetical protein SEA_WIDOW_56 [Gordonia phage Widow]|nr:hypothetical protein SEA_WIDOW_56 [Gordonia phage Widow]